MRYFGVSWGAPVCLDGVPVATPVGVDCGSCGHEITLGDRGLVLVAYLEDAPRDWPVHLDCLLRVALDSAPEPEHYETTTEGDER